MFMHSQTHMFECLNKPSSCLCHHFSRGRRATPWREPFQLPWARLCVQLLCLWWQSGLYGQHCRWEWVFLSTFQKIFKQMQIFSFRKGQNYLFIFLYHCGWQRMHFTQLGSAQMGNRKSHNTPSSPSWRKQNYKSNWFRCWLQNKWTHL